MPIKNYTTIVDAYTSLGEIQSALARSGATKVMVEYANNQPVSVTFSIDTPRGTRGFSLPAPVDGTLKAFARQKVKGDKAQAQRIAWRNVRDWVLAQVALMECCDIPADEVFLPYMINDKGQTLFEVYASGQLLLEDTT